MVKQDNEKLSIHINFRLAKDNYDALMKYLKRSEESISMFMREATFNYLKLKEKFEKIESGEKNG